MVTEDASENIIVGRYLARVDNYGCYTASPWNAKSLGLLFIGRIVTTTVEALKNSIENCGLLEVQ